MDKLKPTSSIVTPPLDNARLLRSQVAAASSMAKRESRNNINERRLKPDRRSRRQPQVLMDRRATERRRNKIDYRV
jgi:hypothetical protein